MPNLGFAQNTPWHPSAEIPLTLAVIIPTYHDDEALKRLLISLRLYDYEIWVVDGADSLITRELCGQAGVRYASSPPGRGQQIAVGVKRAKAEWLWMLHADSDVDATCHSRLAERIAAEPAWGRFNVHISGLGLIGHLMNLRSRLTGICTGDQAMYCHRSLLNDIGGFPAQPLMEDIELSRRLKRLSAPFYAEEEMVGTSARRWRANGIVRTVLSMWWFRLRYFFGASPESLYASYYGRKT